MTTTIFKQLRIPNRLIGMCTGNAEGHILSVRDVHNTEDVLVSRKSHKTNSNEYKIF